MGIGLAYARGDRGGAGAGLVAHDVTCVRGHAALHEGARLISLRLRGALCHVRGASGPTWSTWSSRMRPWHWGRPGSTRRLRLLGQRA